MQRVNAVIRGFCNYYRSDHSGRTFMRLTNRALRSFCKWVSRGAGG